MDSGLAVEWISGCMVGVELYNMEVDIGVSQSGFVIDLFIVRLIFFRNYEK